MFNVNYKKLLVGLMAGVLLIGCSPEESTRKRTMSDDQVNGTEAPLQAKDTSERDQLETLMNQVEPVVEGQMGLEAGQIDAQSLMTRVINPLREVLLDVDFLLSIERRTVKTDSGRFIVPRLVSRFNEAILLVNKANSDLLAQTDLLARYKQNIFWDCDNKLRGSCKMIQFYKSVDSPNMSRIMKLIHDQESLDSEKERIILAAFDLKNRRIDKALRFMLLSRLANSMDKEKRGEMTPLRRRRDADLFANILKINLEEVSGENKYKELIKSLNPWKLSRNIEDDKNQAMSEIIKLAGQFLLYNEDGTLSETLVKKNDDGSTEGVISDLLYVVDKDYEQGVLFQEANIKGEWQESYNQYLEKKEANAGSELEGLTSLEKDLFPKVEQSVDLPIYGPESKNILNTLLKDSQYKSSDLDEFFYLAHQTYFGHFNLDDAQTFWEQTKDNSKPQNGSIDNAAASNQGAVLHREKRILNELEKIIKRQIVNNIVYTNTRMNEFYNNNANSKLIELLRESDKEASKIRKAWAKTIVRAKVVKNLISRIINPAVLPQEQAEQFDRINSSVDALTKNIKFLITYPSMFPLMHVMASGDSSDSIQTFWGTFTIDSTTIISLFFDAYFPPWFNFGNDGAPLDKTEILYTYYYTLATQTFETYSNNDVINFNHEEFFRVVVKKLVLEVENDLDEKRRDLQQDLDEFKNMGRSFERVCNEERIWQPIEQNKLEEMMAEHAAQQELLDEKDRKPFNWYKAMLAADQGGDGVMRRRRAIVNNYEFKALAGNSIYEGNAKAKDKVGHYLNQIYGKTIQNVFKSMYTRIRYTELTAHTLFDIYKMTTDSDPAAIEEIFKKQFENYERIKAEYTKIYFEAEKKYRGCDWLMAQRSKDIRYMLIFREVQELGALFDDVWEAVSHLDEDQKKDFDPNSEEGLKLEEARKKFASATQNPTYPNTAPMVYPSSYVNRFGYNTLTPINFSSFKMDTITRVYAYLNEMFPGQYAVTPPAEWEKEYVYSEVSPSVISFNWDLADKDQAKEAFINAGIKAFNNHMRWADAAVNIEKVDERGQLLTTLFKLGAISNDQNVDCLSEDLSEEQKAENCVKITARELIDHYKKMIDWVNISDLDMVVLNMLGKETKYSQSTYEQLIKKKKEHVLYGYYDLIYKRAFSDGNVTGSEDMWFSSPLISYVQSAKKIKSSTFIFEPDERIDGLFLERYTSWMEEYFKRNKEFLDEVKKDFDYYHSEVAEDPENPKFKPFQFRYRTDKIFTVGLHENASSMNEWVNMEPFISDLVYGKFVGLVQQFNNDTNGYFSSVLDGYTDEVEELVKVSNN